MLPSSGKGLGPVWGGALDGETKARLSRYIPDRAMRERIGYIYLNPNSHASSSI
jgi:hypothetical protein